MLNNAILRYATNNQNAYIKMKIEPFPETEARETLIIGFQVIFYMSMAIMFMAGFIARYIVYER